MNANNSSDGQAGTHVRGGAFSCPEVCRLLVKVTALSTLLVIMTGCVRKPPIHSTPVSLRTAGILDLQGRYRYLSTADESRSPDDVDVARRNLWFDLTLKRIKQKTTGHAFADCVQITATDPEHLLIQALVGDKTILEKTIKVRAQENGRAWLIVDSGEAVFGSLPFLYVLGESHRWLAIAETGELVTMFRSHGLESAVIMVVPVSNELIHVYRRVLESMTSGAE